MTHDELTLAIEQFSPQLRAPEANQALLMAPANGGAEYRPSMMSRCTCKYLAGVPI